MNNEDLVMKEMCSNYWTKTRVEYSPISEKEKTLDGLAHEKDLEN